MFTEGEGSLSSDDRGITRYQCLCGDTGGSKGGYSKYGIIDGDLVYGRDDVYRVHNMIEKPDPEGCPKIWQYWTIYLNPRYLKS